MVVGDLHGLPLIPARPHGLAIGKKLQKLQAAIAGDLKKAAKRKDSESESKGRGAEQASQGGAADARGVHRICARGVAKAEARSRAARA